MFSEMVGVFVCSKAMTDELQSGDVREAGCCQQLINLSRCLHYSPHACPLGKFRQGDRTQTGSAAARRRSVLPRALHSSHTAPSPPSARRIPPLAIAPSPTFCGITVAIATQQNGSDVAAVVGAMATYAESHFAPPKCAGHKSTCSPRRATGHCLTEQ